MIDVTESNILGDVFVSFIHQAMLSHIITVAVVSIIYDCDDGLQWCIQELEKVVYISFPFPFPPPLLSSSLSDPSLPLLSPSLHLTSLSFPSLPSLPSP